MRLIDADVFEEKLKSYLGGTPIGFLLVGALRNEKTIDAVPVVRCRECKNHGSSAFYPDMVFCTEHGRYMKPDGYCCMGERKEGADNDT